MDLTLLEGNHDVLRAGYSCPCGCTPSVEYASGQELAEEGCCCGNHFAVGPRAGAALKPTEGYRAELQTFDAPWGQRLEAAWLIGPSVHGPVPAGDHGRGDAESVMAAIDPVCGMTVMPDTARGRALHSEYRGSDYFFCGKGCKLEFDDSPEHYLDPSYVPSM